MGMPAASIGYNVWVAGLGLLGKTEDFKEPDIKTQKAENPNGTKQDIRILEPMEAEINIDTVNSVVYSAVALGDKATFIIKEAVTEDGKVKQVIHTIVGNIDISENTTKMKERKKKTIKINVLKYIKEVDGEELVFVDFENVIAIVNGVDILADVRNAIM